MRDSNGASRPNRPERRSWNNGATDMGSEPDNLLETDRLEDVLEVAGPPPSVVIVQYRNRMFPWVLAGASIVALTVAGAVAYHFHEIARLQAQALETRRELERLVDQKPDSDDRPKAAAADDAKAPAVGRPPAGSPEETAIKVPAVAGSLTTRGSPSAATPDQPRVRDDSALGASRAAAPQPSGSDSPAPESSKALAQLAQFNDPDRASPARPSAPAGPSSAPAASSQPSESKAPLASASVSEGPSPFEEPSGGAEVRSAPAQTEAVTATTPAPGDARPKGGAGAATSPAQDPFELPAEPPLPSRAETERQIREEAAGIQRENDQRLEHQREELRELQNDERRQFLDELRKLLTEYGENAGPEIERLSVRTGRTDDPVMLDRARRVISNSRMSQRAKVHQLREFGVPETIILDYLANGLDRRLGTRGGPRNRDEVWFRAAYWSVRYDSQDTRPDNARAARGRPATQPASTDAGASPGAGASPPSGGGTPRPR
jgi:hypothetical protein